MFECTNVQTDVYNARYTMNYKLLCVCKGLSTNHANFYHA